MTKREEQGEEMPEKPDTTEAIRRLSEMVDLGYFYGYIGKRSRYGKKPHTQPWGYTSQLLRKWNIPIQVEEVATLFGELGCSTEVEAAEWCVLNEELLPDTQPEDEEGEEGKEG